MNLIDQLETRHAVRGVGQPLEEIHTGAFNIRAGRFILAHVVVHGVTDTKEYAANLATAAFVMERIEAFVKEACDFLIVNRHIRPDARLTNEIYLTFHTFSEKKPRDCTITFHEQKDEGMCDPLYQVHHVHVRFGRDKGGHIDHACLKQIYTYSGSEIEKL